MLLLPQAALVVDMASAKNISMFVTELKLTIGVLKREWLLCVSYNFDCQWKYIEATLFKSGDQGAQFQ